MSENDSLCGIQSFREEETKVVMNRKLCSLKLPASEMKPAETEGEAAAGRKLRRKMRRRRRLKSRPVFL